VAPPKDSAAYIRYFCGDVENPYSLKENEVKRVKLYRSVSHLLRVYADLANDMSEAGFAEGQAQKIGREVRHYEQVRMEIKLASGDYIDLKKYEPAMRTLIDRYIEAEESEKLSTLDNMTLVDLIVKKGEDAVEGLPEEVRQSREATAETIENNVRRLIIDEMPTNPKYYQRMSELLTELIKRRKQEDVEYKDYLAQIVALTKQVKNPEQSEHYPTAVNTKAKQALYDNLGNDEQKALAVHEAVMNSREDNWRGHPQKERKIKIEIINVLPETSDGLKDLFELIKNQNEY
jgi:type I restriction enzyme R subunit